MNKTMVALYDEIDNARAAVHALLELDELTAEDVSLVTSEPYNAASSDLDEVAYTADRGSTHALGGTAKGAGLGVGLGTLGGLLLGLATFALPGVGALVIAGPVMTAVAGAVTGSIAGGLVGGLVGLGIPEVRAHTYLEGLRRGATMVVVNTREEHLGKVARVLEAHSPVDIDERSTHWNALGWDGRFNEAEPFVTRERPGHASSSAAAAE